MGRVEAVLLSARGVGLVTLPADLPSVTMPDPSKVMVTLPDEASLMFPKRCPHRRYERMASRGTGPLVFYMEATR